MRIIVIHKKSQFSRLRDKAKLPLEPAAHALLKLAHEEHEESLRLLREVLTRNGLSFSEQVRGTAFDSRQYDLIISLGGDGTFLAATHHVEGPGPLMVGLKSSTTSVGHLCFGSVQDFAMVLPLLKVRGDWSAGAGGGNAAPDGSVPAAGTLRHRFAVRCESASGRSVVSEPVMNDILFCHADPAETSRYLIDLTDADGMTDSEEHKSSGLWVATAAGSTAAISTIGGRAMPLGSRWLQLKARELYSPTTDLARFAHEFIDPQLHRLRIRNLCQAAIVAIDGAGLQMKLEYDDILELLTAPPVRALERSLFS